MGIALFSGRRLGFLGPVCFLLAFYTKLDFIGGALGIALYLLFQQRYRDLLVWIASLVSDTALAIWIGGRPMLLDLYQWRLMVRAGVLYSLQLSKALERRPIM